jgi:uncharacterized protein (TIGR02246 family)
MHPQDTSSDEQAIRDVISNWLSASKAGDRDTVLQLMAEDAVFLQPGQAPMRGRAAFAAAQEALAGAEIDGRAEIQEIRVAGDLAYCWNHLTVVVTPRGGKPVTRAGHVLSILRKEHGRWVIYRDANLLSSVRD